MAHRFPWDTSISVSSPVDPVPWPIGPGEPPLRTKSWNKPHHQKCSVSLRKGLFPFFATLAFQWKSSLGLPGLLITSGSRMAASK